MERTLSRSLAVVVVLLAVSVGLACGSGSSPKREADCAPSEEICNGVDDDCDGKIDEDLPPITCGLGACAVTVAGCEDGQVPTCTPGQPRAETCDGTDDDCDGQTDEGCACTTGDSRACYGGPEGTRDVGPCHGGAQRCTDGAWGGCEGAVLPAEEVCGNAIDDDCDGKTDETCECANGETRACYGGPAGTQDVGVCVAGTQTCAKGLWGACAGEVRPSDEKCNGKDDDCDGTVDDGNPEAGAACHTGLPGVCDAGTLSCQDGRPVCTQAVAPTADVCNGVDDDCNPDTPDGAAEAWFGDPCDGPDGDLCLEGKLICQESKQACDDATSTTVEICNGVDDDCDGEIDEGFHTSTATCDAATVLGEVAGDAPSTALVAYDTREAWYAVTIKDDASDARGYLGARVHLTLPSGTSWDLEVYCASCGGGRVWPYWSGNGLTVDVRRNDTPGVDDTFLVYVKVRFWSAWGACDAWQLQVDGDQDVANATCS